MALIAMPVCYGVLCVKMRREKVPETPYFPFFCIFGSFGGWFLAFALSPSGLAGVCTLFLMTIAPFFIAYSTFKMSRLKIANGYHRAATYSSVGYFLLLAIVIVVGFFVAK